MNSICKLLTIEYPIIQAGMVWCSGWELASASTESGILGVIGAGSMYPNVLLDHIQKTKNKTSKPFAVNLPLLYPDIEAHLDIIVSEKVPIVITSAGNPKKFTSYLISKGIKVLHVVSSVKFALKAQEAGVDAIIAEGFEAGGHNGRDETTTLVLTPAVVDAVDVPVVAAGGIKDGRSMLACFALGADAVQIGSRFVLSHESSAHAHFKKAVQAANEGDTLLTLKELTPVRLLNNPFFQKIQDAYSKGTTSEELRILLGKGRAKKGMFLGDLENGELEIGQVAAFLNELLPVETIVQNTIQKYNKTLTMLKKI